MATRELPDLDATDRRYLQDTTRPRLQSPGIQRVRPERRPRTLRNVATATLFAVALIALLLWLAGRM